MAIRRFGGIPAEHDVDHVHARNFAVQFGYRFVLVALVPGKEKGKEKTAMLELGKQRTRRNSAQRL